jgi:hypothetical protein
MMITADKLSNAEYHAKEAISSSDVKMVSKSTLAHWKAKVYKSSTTFDIGTAVHAMVLEGDKNLVLRGPETRRGNDWKKPYEQAQAEGKTLLTAGDYDLAKEMADSLIMHPIGDRMSGDTVINEASFFATDDKTGLDLKTRPDSYWQANGIVYDIKTCQAADPKSFAKDCLNYGYHIQAAFYLHVLNLAGYQADKFLFACIEKTAPYAVAVHELSEEYLEYGRFQMEAALNEIAEANASGIYGTGWSNGVNTIDLPSWISPADFN